MGLKKQYLNIIYLNNVNKYYCRKLIKNVVETTEEILTKLQ